MSERCNDAMECRPDDLRRALSIHTRKITDSCRDKDCIEELRVYLTRESQTVLDTAAAEKVRSAELVYSAIDVSPVAFHRNHYTIDLTSYYKVIADAAVGPCRPAAICGLAMFSKRAVLCGENTGAHIFRSDCPGNSGGSLPTAVVEVMDTNSQGYKTGAVVKCSSPEQREERRMKREKKRYFLTKMIKKVPKGHLFSSLFAFLSSLRGCCKYLQHPPFCCPGSGL